MGDGGKIKLSSFLLRSLGERAGGNQLLHKMCCRSPSSNSLTTWKWTCLSSFSFLLSLLLASFHQHIFVGHILNPGIFISSEDTAVNRPKKSCPHGLWILVRKIDRKQIIYGRIYGMSDGDKSYGEKLNRQEKYEEQRRKQLSLGWSEKASKEVTG